MTDFIQAYDAEINAALDEQGAAVHAARERFAERAQAAEIALIAAMTHRGRMYVTGYTTEESEAPNGQTSLQIGKVELSNYEAEGHGNYTEEASR